MLTYKLGDKSIADVLEMTVEQALFFFDIKEVVRKLQAMSDVGLDYLTLGQPLSTLSGGECQRIKLASELHKNGSIYVMDEPTTGLHMSDISHLLAMNRLVDTDNNCSPLFLDRKRPAHSFRVAGFFANIKRKQSLQVYGSIPHCLLPDK